MPPDSQTQRSTEDLGSVDSLRNKILNASLIAFTVFLWPALAASLLRALDVGWNFTIPVHVGAAAVVSATVILRKRLSFPVKAGVMLGILFLIGVVGLVTWGLLGMGIVFLITCSSMVAILFGTRPGAIVAGAGMLAAIAVAGCVWQGWISFNFDANQFALAPTAWVTMLAAYALFAALLVVSAGRLRTSLLETIRALSQEVAIRQETETALQQANRYQAQLLNTGRYLTGTLDLQEVLTRIASEAAEILDAFGCALYILEEDQQTLTPVVVIDPDFEEQVLCTPLGVDTSFTGQAVKAQQGMIFNEAENDFTGCQIPGTPEQEQEHIIAAPFIVEGKVLGAMCLNRMEKIFSNEDLVLANTFANYAATALKNAQTHRELEHHIEEHRQAVKQVTRFGNILENSLNEIYTFDAATLHFTEVNRGARDNLGYSMEELRCLTPLDLKPEFTFETFEHKLAPLRAGETQQIAFTTVHRRRDGSSYPVEIHLQLNTLETPAVFVAIALDISKRRQAEAEREEAQARLLQAQKMEGIGQLAGGIAHDFNNLLTGILGYANIIRLDTDASSSIQQAAGTIERAAERAAELTNQLLGFARQGKNQDIPVDMHQIIQETINLISRSFDKNITIAQRLHASNANVMGDPSQLQQMTLNLAINARDALPEGGHLTLETTMLAVDESDSLHHLDVGPGDYWMMSISDDGCGIPDEHLDHIFEPFFTTKEPGQGTGMGLAMVYGIVKSHHGFLDVLTQMGQGTTFNVYLPAADQPAAMKFGPGDEIQPGTGQILLVDDEEVIRDVGAALLQSLGYQVLTAVDGKEAVDTYRRLGSEIDLVMIDMVMPEMGGRECLNRLQELDPGVRVILSTGYGLNEKAQEIIDAGALAFVQKPYRLDQLSQVLGSVFQPRQ